MDLPDRLTDYLSTTTTPIHYRDISEDLHVGVKILNDLFNSDARFVATGLVGVDRTGRGRRPRWAKDAPHAVATAKIAEMVQSRTIPHEQRR